MRINLGTTTHEVIDLQQVPWQGVYESHEAALAEILTDAKQRHYLTPPFSLPMACHIFNSALQSKRFRSSIPDVVMEANLNPLFNPDLYNSMCCVTAAVWGVMMHQSGMISGFQYSGLVARMPRPGATTAHPHGMAMFYNDPDQQERTFLHLMMNRGYRTSYAEITEGDLHKSIADRTYPVVYPPEQSLQFIYDIAAGLQQYHESR